MSIQPDIRVRWQDGDVERIGWVAVVFDSGKAYVQDEAMYTWKVDAAKLVLAPYTDEENAAFDEHFAAWRRDYGGSE